MFAPSAATSALSPNRPHVPAQLRHIQSTAQCAPRGIVCAHEESRRAHHPLRLIPSQGDRSPDLRGTRTPSDAASGGVFVVRSHHILWMTFQAPGHGLPDNMDVARDQARERCAQVPGTGSAWSCTDKNYRLNKTVIRNTAKDIQRPGVYSSWCARRCRGVYRFLWHVSRYGYRLLVERRRKP